MYIFIYLTLLHSAQVSEDGRHLVLVHKHSLELFDLHSAEPDGPRRHSAPLDATEHDVSPQTTLAFRGRLLACWSPSQRTLYVFDVPALRPRHRFNVPFSRPLGPAACLYALFLGEDTVIVDGNLVLSWRRQPGRLLRQLDYSALARMHAVDMRAPAFLNLDALKGLV